MRTDESSIQLRNGVTLRYAEHGSASGLPLVLLPGLGDSWRSFAPALDLLPDSVRALAVTQRGHGDADHPQEGYGFSDFADDLEALLDALAVEATVIAAHSASGFFAQRFAIDNPERTLGLVLIATPLTLRDHPGLHEAWDSTISKLTDPVDPGFVRDMQAGTLNNPIPDDLFETLVTEAMKVPARVWKESFQHLLNEDCSREVGKITAPTLIVWGEADAVLSRADQDALFAAIEGAELKVYPRLGHSPHWEDPQRFASDLTAFIRSLPTAQAQGSEST